MKTAAAIVVQIFPFAGRPGPGPYSAVFPFKKFFQGQFHVLSKILTFISISWGSFEMAYKSHAFAYSHGVHVCSCYLNPLLSIGVRPGLSRCFKDAVTIHKIKDHSLVFAWCRSKCPSYILNETPTKFDGGPQEHG